LILKIELNAEGFILLNDFYEYNLTSSQLWRASFGLEAKALFVLRDKIDLATSL
jgi:hypothetical protein